MTPDGDEEDSVSLYIPLIPPLPSIDRLAEFVSSGNDVKSSEFVNVNALSFDAAVELVEMDDFFVVPSALATDTVDADVFARSRGVGVLTSLLLLSFRLKRRTGFLRIRLKLAFRLLK